jgi:glycyl-tRNA synthetase beta chain
VQGLTEFRAKPEFEPLAVVFKRVANILKGIDYSVITNPALFEMPQEVKLHDRYLEMRETFDSRMNEGDYEAVMRALARLRAPVDEFFDHVLVMAEDKRLRDNRLALLGEIHGLFSQVADFSRVMVADFGERANSG